MTTTSSFGRRVGERLNIKGKAGLITKGLHMADLAAKGSKPMSEWEAGLFINGLAQKFSNREQVAEWANHFHSKGQPKNKHGEEVLKIWKLIIQQAIPSKDFKEIRISKYDGTTIFVLNKEGETAKRLKKGVDIFYPDSRKEWDENPLLTEEFFVIYPMFLLTVIQIFINDDEKGSLFIDPSGKKWYEEIRNRYEDE